jgi:hypothetical protein
MDPVTFANNLFQTEIKPISSIQLQLEDMNIGDLFEFLLIVFTNGLKHFYGNTNNRVDLTTVNSQQFENINKYFHSFGFECMYVVYPITAETEINFQKISYQNMDIDNNTNIKNMCFPIKVKDRIYAIGFNYYINSEIPCGRS